MKKESLEHLIEQAVKEELGSLIGNFFFGKDRNGGDKNPPEWQKTQGDYDSYVEEFKSIMPQIKKQKQFKKAKQLANSLGTNEVGASFKVYDVIWRMLETEGWSGAEDDATAAMAVFHTLRR